MEFKCLLAKLHNDKKVYNVIGLMDKVFSQVIGLETEYYIDFKNDKAS